MQKQDTGFLELIAAGNTIGAPEGDLLKCAGTSVPTAYRNELMRLVVVFADSELAGAAGFCPFINRGPGLRERIVAAKIVTEKYVHAELALALLKPFGVNPLLYVRSHAWDSRLDRHLDLGTRRIGGDKRLNVFHYPLEGWEDALVFNMLMGAATAIQLAEMQHCSYLPLAEAIGQILPREQEHAKLGESGVAQAIERGGNQAAVQAAVNYWYPRVTATFGRVDSDHATTYIQYGLRRRSSTEMLGDWKAQSAASLKRLGLAVAN
ncbi:MAG: phenylacetate-CoA oxygenase subunit PaaI [Burkholderiaceae bacterium]|nr:phenylacetate-CoA oxygenase subunit PaaI [Sulfuritalea sp.]MCF8174521.1 phenylacetate-CoA oxygenase subunit PaaI [Burkholderiaceae bacterium]